MTFDLVKLEAWLEKHPPKTLLAFCDRLLLATVGRTRELETLIKRAPEVLAELDTMASDGSVLHQITNALLLLAVFEDEGVDVEATKSKVAPTLFLARQLAEKWVEPWSSVFFYWQTRARLGSPRAVGGEPPHPYLRAYYYLHRILYACDYGKRATLRTPYDAMLRDAAAFAESRPNDSDVLAEVLLAETMLTPADPALRQELANRLGTLQNDDGSMRVPPEHKNFAAIHHAACVSLLAMRLLDAPPMANPGAGLPVS